MLEKIKNNAVTITISTFVGIIVFAISQTWTFSRGYSDFEDRISYIEKTYVNKTEFEKLQVKMDFILQSLWEIKDDMKDLKNNFILKNK